MATAEPTGLDYTATRVTYDSTQDFAATGARLDEQIPLFDSALTVELVIGAATWADVQDSVKTRVGPQGLVALARLDQGAPLSLSGEPVDATLCLVGNPLVARQVTGHNPAGALYAPFRVAVFADATGVHVAYDQPSSFFASLGSTAIDDIAVDLDRKISAAAQHACGGGATR
jgi:uncharacterized protein (DUF302 family)